MVNLYMTMIFRNYDGLLAFLFLVVTIICFLMFLIGIGLFIAALYNFVKDPGKWIFNSLVFFKRLRQEL